MPKENCEKRGKRMKNWINKNNPFSLKTRGKKGPREAIGSYLSRSHSKHRLKKNTAEKGDFFCISRDHTTDDIFMKKKIGKIPGDRNPGIRFIKWSKGIEPVSWKRVVARINVNAFISEQICCESIRFSKNCRDGSNSRAKGK